ncbi:MAG: hypothetical protein ABIH82_05390 [Candidatus Woesearchaeota archaeon]
MQTNCPECKHELHHGQHKFADGMYDVYYCKKCGFKKETPLY